MSLIEQIRPLDTDGLSIEEIVNETGISRRQVTKTIWELRRREERIESVHRAAEKRGVTVADLWRSVQRIVATENLFDAILDDGGSK